MAKTNITTIVKTTENKCRIFNDDGIFCAWTDVQEYGFDLVAKTKAEAEGFVMFVTENDAQRFAGEHMTIDNPSAWVISRDILWILNGEVEARASEKDFVTFIREHLI